MNTPPDSINEFAVIGSFGFQRVTGPFQVTKDGTVWEITVPHETAQEQPTVNYITEQNGESVAIVVDCNVVGGGVLTDVIDKGDAGEIVLLVDQYAMGGIDE